MSLVPKAGARLGPEEFLAWCEEKLPHFAVPRYVEVKAELPKTPSNKVQKFLLRQAGVLGDVWDRVKAGYRLRAEMEKAEQRRREKRSEGSDVPRAIDGRYES